MSSPKYTGGNWEWSRENSSTWVVRSDEYGTICGIHQYPDKIVMPDEQCEATAALIAAAPDLYAACEDVLGVLSSTTATDEVTRGTIVGSVNVLRAVVAKARGDESP